MNTSEIIAELKRNTNHENRAGMARYGIEVKDAFGVPMPFLRKMAKDIGKDHDLALQLWDSGVYEARIIVSLIIRISQRYVKS